MPVLLWLAAELCVAGRPLVALVLCTLLACSPYFVDCLSLPHSGVGFYLIAILTIVCLAVYTALHPALSWRGLFVRAGVASLVFALCTLVRSGTLLISPGFALALAIGCWRLTARGESTRSHAIRAIRPLALLLVLFPLPYWLVRPAEHHFVWSDIWKGIGDFDRQRVHPNKDGEATKELRRAGVPLGPDPGFPFVSPETEVYFRESVLRDIRSDPGWAFVIEGLARAVRSKAMRSSA